MENKQDKYAIARDFRDGVIQCLKGAAIDPNKEQDSALYEGYEWAYRFVKPILNEEMNRQVVKRGHKPFCQIECMR